MAISESLCFVQFMHPGREPRLRGAAKSIPWNSSPRHARKYLHCPGTYIEDGKPVSGPMEFWGEWEPESEVIEEWGWQPGHKPQRAWRPYYEAKPDYAGLQNTDPFVFGSFLYTGCKQYTGRGTRATQLRYLSRGTVLLFGSRVGGAFALDTVFVVKDWIDHDAATYRDRLAGRVPDAYWDVTLYPWYDDGSRRPGWGCKPPAVCAVPGDANSRVRLYFGATYDDPVEGMFSFVPCAPAGTISGGFARPVIDLDGVINPKNKQSPKINRNTILSDAVRWWRETQQQVQGQGLRLGVSLAIPTRLCPQQSSH